MNLSTILIRNAMYFAIPCKISQVLINILKNSSESIDQRLVESNDNFKGMIIYEINLKNEETVEVQIRDNGIGIKLPMLEKIFDPYITTKTKGTGLGLAIVKKNY